jgi:hypothetical protein
MEGRPRAMRTKEGATVQKSSKLCNSVISAFIILLEREDAILKATTDIMRIINVIA